MIGFFSGGSSFEIIPRGCVYPSVLRDRIISHHNPLGVQDKKSVIKTGIGGKNGF